MPDNQQFLIALGGNLPSEAGKPADTLRAALDRLVQSGVVVEAVSRFFRTPCFPAGAGPDYVNAAAVLRYHGDPQTLLRVLHEVEAHFGRDREVRWARRTLDLDLIAAGDAVLPNAEGHAAWRNLPAEQQAMRAPDELILPHPRLQDRAFVLVPLADVAAEWCHPVLNKTVSQMLEALEPDAVDEVVAL
ncbi:MULTISPECIES: 2-amino-4-hydroxy-6-hydroxymethyldihydropteridine diphosphokinase [unclassified Roseovarius]|uniref:2-amino-4-hydroxy-6- hydroxymethyldihydropteridine diphosphokinase n=1 Tax=unclassified Roseovarius TaxID=2614913 RepID=UPI00273F9603|nr:MULTISPECIES: 2-amino-4-hydroxy-6-hydroxymethyldihydropteridine diphosphokinase [unclassified Roseovarius]